LGNGATNTSTVSGMLPATSNSSPYVITYAGLLSDGSVYDISSPAWCLFDGVPEYPTATSYPTNPEFLNIQDSEYSGLRGVMVDLGESNAKCFDKFSYCGSAFAHEYFMPGSILIQGSNSIGVTVSDDVLSEWWTDLFSGNACGWVIGGWQPFKTWVNNIKYRFYRVIVLANSAYQGNQWAAAEFLFVEEQIITAETTRLLLHMNGANESPVFIDSSNLAHTVTADGSAQQDTAIKKLGSASGKFTTEYDSLSIVDVDKWDIFQDQFAIHFWFYPDTLSMNQVIFSQYENPGNFMTCIYDYVLGNIVFELWQSYARRILVKAAVTLELETWNHIALVGSLVS
jgi:hypothetical protein